MLPKGQLYSQVFIYIISIVVVGLILGFGYKSITGLQEKGCDICVANLRNQLEGSVDGIIADYGSVERKDIQMCCDFSSICLIESIDSFSVPTSLNPIIKDSIKSKTGMNAFLESDKLVQPFNIGKISVEPNVLCIKGKAISLKLEGKGNYVQVSKWS